MTQNVVPLKKIPPIEVGEKIIEIDPFIMIGVALLAYTGVVSLPEAREMIGMPPMTGKQKMVLATMARFVKRSGRNFSVIWSEFWPRGE